MQARFPRWLAMIIVGGLSTSRPAWSQDVPKGVEVMARGAVHEAYAEPSEVRPEASPLVTKQPPDPVQEQHVGARLGQAAEFAEHGRGRLAAVEDELDRPAAHVGALVEERQSGLDPAEPTEGVQGPEAA